MQRFGQTTLDGVNFFARDHQKLKQTLIDAKDSSGAPFFAHAILDNLDHWALKTSFLATVGTGFREASRLKLRDNPLIGNGPLHRRDSRGWRRNAGRFVRAFPEPDILPEMSSLHCAVSNQGCNIHVDDVGFVLYDHLGNLVVDLDVVQHLFNELIFKTYGKSVLPEAIVNRAQPRIAKHCERLQSRRGERRRLQDEDIPSDCERDMFSFRTNVQVRWR
jgi:hypothetical protein